MQRSHLRGLVIAAAAAALAALPSTAEAQCSAGFTLTAYAGGSSCYRLTTISSGWSAVNAEAVSFGGWLAAIGSAAENAAARSFVDATLVGNNQFFIGFNDIASEGSFVWSNGEAVSYTNWSGGEPNNLFDEDATEMLGSGAWNDIPDSPNAPRYGLVESAVATSTVPEPATVALLAGGLLGIGFVGARRRRVS